MTNNKMQSDYDCSGQILQAVAMVIVPWVVGTVMWWAAA